MTTETQEMELSYLIQRLEQPLPARLPLDKLCLSFGGGLVNGGLPENVMDMLRPIFRFDYMGSAEFEYGAVRDALRGLVEDADQLVAHFVTVKTEREDHGWLDETTEPVEAFVYYLCRRTHQETVINRIIGWASRDESRHFRDPAFRIKERVRLNSSIRTRKRDVHSVVGWLELDNGFFFFIDKPMWKKTCALFGLDG